MGSIQHYQYQKNLDGNWKIVRDTKNQEESTDEQVVDISKIDFDQLACEIIDQYESDRLESGRAEIVSGMKYILEKYTDSHDRKIIDEMLMIFTG